MPFEEYQFLRYFIPGSLFVIYTTLIIYPALSLEILLFLEKNPEIVLGIIGGVFAGSLAFGYLVYTLYDTFLYNIIAMNPKRRKLPPKRITTKQIHCFPRIRHKFSKKN